MKKIVNNRPIMFCSIAFIVGIVVSAYAAHVFYLFYILLFVLALFVLLSFFLKNMKGLKATFIAVLLFFVAGYFYTAYNINLYNQCSRFDGADCTLSGCVSSVDVYDSGDTRVSVSKLKIDGESVYGKAFFYIEEISCKEGDNITFTGTINFKNYSVKNYASQLLYEVTVDDYTVSENTNNPFYAVFYFVKNNIQNNVSDTEAGIMTALLLGDTSEMDDLTLTTYRLSGVSHIFAVSGLHVVFFTTLIASFLRLVKIRGVKQSVITALMSVFYAGVCGFPVSAVRAVIMTTVLNFTKNLGRKYDQINSLCLSLIIVLLIFPYSLFTYAFILSYMAVAGILLFNRGFKKLLGFLSEWLCSSLSVSAAVSVFMTPILFKMWGYASLIVVLLNVIIVPLVSVLYSLLFLANVIFAIFPSATFIWDIPYYVAYTINTLMIELNPTAFTVYHEISDRGIVSYYFFILLSNDRTNLEKPTKICFWILAFVALLLSMWGVI